MAWTEEQIKGASIITITQYKNTLSPTDSDYEAVVAEVNWRNARIAWNDADKLKMKNGPGSNPPGNPPPPPGA